MSKLETIFLLRHPYREKFVVVVDDVVDDDVVVVAVVAVVVVVVVFGEAFIFHPLERKKDIDVFYPIIEI